jgi:ferrous iron transport protein A
MYDVGIPVITGMSLNEASMAAAEQHICDVPDCLELDRLPTGDIAYVVGLRAPEGSGRDMLRRLQELGFLEGEPVRITARGFPGGAPLAVRIGSSTFALRRYEARCVLVSRQEHHLL